MSKAFVIPTQFTAVDRFSSPVRRMSDSVERFAINSRASLAFAERGFRRLMAPISAINRMMMGAGVYVGLYSFINVLRGVIKTIADFQEAQINIATVTHRSVSENKALSDQARKMAVQYGMAAESVSNLQYELIKMGLAEKKGGMQNVIDATPAITLGAKAMNAPVDELSKIVGSGMSLFGKTPQQLVDLYAVGLDKSALDFQSFATMLRNAQQGWALTKKPVEELVSLLAIASNAFVHTASAGTGIKNMTIDNAVAMKELSDQMDKIIASENPLKAIYKMYGRKTFQVATPISEAFASGDFQKFVNMFQPGEVQGYTDKIAEMRMQSIKGIWSKVKTSWEELILSIDEGSGKISAALSNIGRITTAMFLLASGSDIAREQLTRMDSATIQTAQSWLGLIEKVWTFIKILIFLKAVMIAYRAILAIVAITQAGFSVAMGIAAAMGKMNIMSLRGNAIAMGTLRAVTVLTTPSLWAMNAAMWASPLLILAIGIFAVVGGFSLMNNWISDMTGNFGVLSGSVNAYSESLKNIPTVKDLPTLSAQATLDRPTNTFAEQKAMLGNQDLIDRTDRAWNIEKREQLKERVTPRSIDQDAVSELAALLKGSVVIDIKNNSDSVKSVSSDGDLIKVKTNSTFGNQKKQ